MMISFLRFRISIVFLLVLLFASNWGFAQEKEDVIDGFTYPGNLITYRQTDNSVDFKCQNGIVSLQICSDDIIRIRMRKQGKFKEDENWVVIKYDWQNVDFSIVDSVDYVAIKTSRLVVKAYKLNFHFEFSDLSGKVINKDWPDGSMGFRGDQVICRKNLSPTDHFFGLGQRYDKSDLRGTKNVCAVSRHITPVPFFMGTDGYGIFFHNTWKSEFDFTQNPYTFYAPGGAELDYYFIYGPSFKSILYSYSLITGFSPLPPKWAFGLFYSRWNQEVDGWKYAQDGQNGMLRTIDAVRDVWNWPLDGIRVHSQGPDQNFYASPKTHWPDMGWGEFQSVDTFVMKLKARNIHSLFWESPGVTGGCKMFDEGVKNNYFLTKNGQTHKVVFGYTQPPGGLVDFMNPEARSWWGRYHHYMVDFGSDGVAGDWDDEKVTRGTMSPSTGLGSDEFMNVYSLLFNKASWDAYKERNPNKRSINFGLVYWAGGQRYPMQGTQDSDLEGKVIYGEMMGCINLGLSGIPFRTYTDNVSRSLLPNLPLSRLSQYLSLTVAGERTLAVQTGNEMADWNYRFYGRLRYRLMPYIYTYAREASVTAVPLVRSLVLENQTDPEAYDAYCQYLLGESILIAPLWSDTTFYREIYLPEGEWIDFFDGKIYNGKQTITFHAPIDKVPIFIKSGAIIPMAPENQKFIDEIKSPITFAIYPKTKSSFDLYEDDAESYNYEKGQYAITNITYTETKRRLEITKRKPVGPFTITERDHVFCIMKSLKVFKVLLSKQPIKKANALCDFDKEKTAWYYDKAAQKLWIKTAGGANTEISLAIVVKK